MDRFDACLAVVLGHEGGYVNHPNDRGGATNKGVTQRRYDEYRASIGLPLQDVKNITNEEVTAIYKKYYWIPARCDRMPPPLDLMLFDAAVNHGPSRAVKMLQRVLGVTEDGIVGPKTLAALDEDVAAHGVEWVCQQFLQEREAFYRRIVDADAAQKVFLKGWLARVEHLREYLA